MLLAMPLASGVDSEVSTGGDLAIMQQQLWGWSIEQQQVAYI